MPGPDPGRGLHVLIDQNISREVAAWMRILRPTWKVVHTSDVGLQSLPDEKVYAWAQAHGALI